MTIRPLYSKDAAVRDVFTCFELEDVVFTKRTLLVVFLPWGTRGLVTALDRRKNSIAGTTNCLVVEGRKKVEFAPGEARYRAGRGQ